MPGRCGSGLRRGRASLSPQPVAAGRLYGAGRSRLGPTQWLPRKDAHGQACVHYGRGRLLPRQGHHRGLPRAFAQEPGTPRRDAEVRPLPQRRPRHHEPLPARRGVRHRGRRRDRPRPGALRALRRREPLPRLEHHLGLGLLQRHPQGAAGRLPRRHRPGDPAHHQRDQGADAARVPQPRGRRGHHRDRRDGGRHREPAVPRGHPPVPQRRGPAERAATST